MAFVRRRSAPRCISGLLLLSCLLSIAHPGILSGQGLTKSPISFDDLDSWRSLQGAQISRDGSFVAYVMQPQDGDGDLMVRSTTSEREWKVARGYRPPTPPPDPSDPIATQAFQAMQRLLRPVFSADSKHLFFLIEPEKAEILKARREKKRPEESPKNALGIMELSTGKVTRIENLKSFQVPEEAAGYVAILKEAAREERNPDLAAANPAAARPTPAMATGTPMQPAAAESPSPTPSPSPSPSPGPRGSERRREYGTQLLLRRGADGETRTFADVLEYTFSKDGKSLVYAVSSRRDANNGAFVVTPGSNSAPMALLKGPGRYQKFTWDEKQTQLAFISDQADAASKQPRFDVYHWPRHASAAAKVVSATTPNFRSEFVVSEKGSLAFSYDGSRLFTSSAPPPDPEPDPNDAVPEEEKVTVDLWHWKDDHVQSVQKVRAAAERDRSYRGVWHIQDQRFVQLADKTLENITPNSNGLYAIGTDDRPYRIRATYQPGYSDYYIVNTLDGSRRLVLKNTSYALTWSPGGKYAIFFDGKDWNTVSMPDLKITNITGKLKARFTDEQHDTPDDPSTYGLAGWTSDDRDVLIYDRFDIWQVASDGSGGKLLTDGRKSNISFRNVRLDPDERFIRPDQTLLLRAENEENRDSGYYRLRLGTSAWPEKLYMQAANVGTATKARSADTLMFAMSRFDRFPDIWASGLDLSNPRKLSNGDAQRAPFNWGTAELIRYKSKDGQQLKGIVIKPENFDPTRKYPLMVNFYERSSNTLHNFRQPAPGTSVNLSYYASNDYVVFLPDVVYKVGYPGKSAMNCVLPGIDAVVDKGYIDEKRIGVQGHSWGGYQIAYMITQTDRFRAAAPGALVANMFSAYNGIRWGSGLPRQFQYEHGQSRIGGQPWNATKKFIENSPLFYVENVRTPVIMIHNDNDDAVPWYQGIEFYLSLRRLGKEAYLFNYNGEYHNLLQRQNQKDYSRRMKEFFDHFLKDAPAPEWMRSGIPYLQRDKEKEQYRKPKIKT